MSSSSSSSYDVYPIPGGGRGIRLVVQFIYGNDAPLRASGAGFIVTAQDPRNMPDEIFKFQRFPNPGGEDQDEFIGVATPSSLEDYWANNPKPGTVFYRTHTMEIWRPTISMTEEAWAEIYLDVVNLVNDLNAMDRLGAGQTLDVGIPADPEVSSSST